MEVELSSLASVSPTHSPAQHTHVVVVGSHLGRTCDAVREHVVNMILYQLYNIMSWNNGKNMT